MELNIFVVFIAGIATFLAPCIIPLVPSYLSYISGISMNNVSDAKNKFSILINTIFFILGFGSAFSALQVILSQFTNLASKLIGNNILYLFFGSIIILMGLNMLGIFKITRLYSEKRFSLTFKKRNLFTSYLFGFAFGFGWTPCMGPVLFTVMSYLSSSNSLLEGIFYIWIYTLGLGVPFIVFALLLDKSDKLSFIRKNFLLSNRVSGFILIVIGFLLATNKMDIFLSFGFRNEIIAFFKSLFN